MNKLIKKISLLITLLSVMTACSDNDISSTNEILPEKSFLEQAYNRLYGNSRSVDQFDIIELETKTFEIVNDSAVEIKPTRNHNTENQVFNIKTAILNFKGTNGFAVFSDDDIIKRVFFITENGDYTYVDKIEPLKELIDGIPQNVVAMLNDSNNCLTRTALPNQRIENICRFKWGQGSPYNLYASVCNCPTCTKLGGQNPIGCVTTAIAQAIATIGVFPGTYYGNKNIDFSKCEIDYRKASLDKKWQIGQFFHEIAHGCQVKYGCSEGEYKGSITTLSVAQQYLSEIGYKCVYEKGTIDVTRVLANIKQSIPHIMGGNSGTAGHTWIITGISINNGQIDYYCNWGSNGDYNGWSYGNPYSTPHNEYSYPNNHDHIYINSKYL